MAQVRLLTSMAGIDFSHNTGDVIDCNEAEAKRYIDAGIAEAVNAAAPIERGYQPSRPGMVHQPSTGQAAPLNPPSRGSGVKKP